ncbi:MAG: T9SS type A sorting domain-containing protein [Ignavibacteriaceae bacterium]|nr:T9SS type A sorting domain-containing protein [Ignavibacteriaceae bacterium]
MKARDYNNNVSGFSSTVSIEFQRYSPNAPGGSGSWVNKSTESGGNNISYVYTLSQNYPNPFNPTTTISYAIKTAGEVTLKVYDMLGIEIASLVNEIKEAGNYSVEFNAATLPSGIYVYRLTSGNFVDTKKLILLK